MFLFKGSFVTCIVEFDNPQATMLFFSIIKLSIRFKLKHAISKLGKQFDIKSNPEV